MIAVLTVAVVTWLLSGAAFSERLAPHRAPARIHGIYLAALVGAACTLAMAAGWLALARAGQVEIPPAAHFSLGAMGKFPESANLSPAVPIRVGNSWQGAYPVLLAIWSAGFAACLARLAHRYLRVIWLLRRSRPVTDAATLNQVAASATGRRHGSTVRVRESEAIASPMVWGPPGATLILPTSWNALHDDPTAWRMLVTHELAHIERRDTLTTLVAQVAAAVVWFHPLAWYASGRLARLQEHCADRRVVEQGFRPSQYAEFLVRVARQAGNPPTSGLETAPSFLGGSPLQERLRRLLAPVRAPVGSAAPRLAAIMLLMTVPVAGLAWMAPEDTASGLTQPSLEAVLNPLFVDKMQDLHIAGAAISVVDEEHTVYTKGWGRAEVYTPRTVDPYRTIFRIGSVSKVVTGVAVMQLVDRGLLDLDADVNRYLKTFRVDDRFDEPVRVRHLLTHTAGFDQFGYGRHADTREDVRPLGDFLAENLVRIRPPGQLSCYDTYAITLAGYLVELRSGMTFEDYLAENVFGPLEMHRTSIVVPPALAGDVAVGYGFAGSWEAQPWEYMNTNPASTINSTVADMANFARMLLNEGEFDGRRILSKRSVKAMLSRQHTNDPRLPGYGLTFWEDRSFGVAAFSHGGSMTGFGCFLYLVPEHELGVFVAYNQESGGLASLAIRKIVETFLPHAVRSPERRPDWRGNPDLSPFLGTYADTMHNHTRPARGGWRRQPFELSTDDQGSLVFSGRPCRRVGRLAFERDDGALLVFREDDHGQVTHLLVKQRVYERVADNASD